MRRLMLAVAALCALAAVALPVAASARPGPALTIRAIPNPINAGDPLVIVGHLGGSANTRRLVRLFHRLAGQRSFSQVQTTRTDAAGNYVFVRQPGVVETNRDWFARSEGVRSRVVREGVHALVTLAASPTSVGTNRPVVFSGHVTPNHAGGLVRLQEQVGGNGDDWRNIRGAVGRLGRGSDFRIVHRFDVPGTRTIRAVIRRDRRNLQGASSSVDVTVQQTQNPQFTLAPSADPIRAGDSVSLKGTLAGPGNANQVVTLFAHERGRSYQAVAQTQTDASGNYAFTQSPPHTTVYQARSGARRSAQVFEAVRDVVTAQASPANPTVGQAVSMTGTVSPNKAGHFIELQRQGPDGDYHTIEVVRVKSDSSYEFLLRFGAPGTKRLRVHINGGPRNWGANSDPLTVMVSPGPSSGSATQG